MSLKLIKMLQKEQNISERDLSEKAGISRGTLRASFREVETLTVKNIKKIAQALNYETQVLVLPKKDPPSEDAISVVSYLAAKDGEWKIHFFNFLDAFRRTKDERLIILPPVAETPLKLKALLASMVCQLCLELGLDIPAWANRTYFLPEPWFVAGIENLKAMALVESPLFFRRNNIFVLSNFLSRV